MHSAAKIDFELQQERYYGFRAGNEIIFSSHTVSWDFVLFTVPGRDEDDAAGARHAGEAEQPQEDSVQNHRHVFPVIGHLGGTEM